MKNFLLAFSFLTIFNGAFGQSIQIMDKTNEKSIPYANIIFIAGGEISGGTYSDRNGKANLLLDEEIDSIEVSCLGYFSKKFTVGNLASKIYLERKDEVLQEVIVLSEEASTQYVGIIKERGSHSMTAFRGYEMVVFTENPFDEEKRVKSFEFSIKKRRTDKDVKFKVVFYKNQNGFPSEKINVEKVVGLNTIKKRRVVVNFDSTYLALPPEGFFAGIKWMGCIDDEEYADLTYQPDYCQLGIICNYYYDEKIYNQTFTRNTFATKYWLDDSDYPSSYARSRIPIFGVNVYE